VLRRSTRGTMALQCFPSPSASSPSPSSSHPPPSSHYPDGEIEAISHGGARHPMPQSQQLCLSLASLRQLPTTRGFALTTGDNSAKNVARPILSTTLLPRSHSSSRGVQRVELCRGEVEIGLSRGLGTRLVHEHEHEDQLQPERAERVGRSDGWQRGGAGD